ncbi:GroES-like protein [Lepidopterella palustris CBS 459.81]|uniref:GroES-like protein n=1 Tax=Lepidopterella palustris CBS 459.81 TaxID=1314670 RepID=A0A8E2E0P9_9PEZI|nr:GroES-like protein [Lepidopterella palustris CBS 459.81]
MTPHSRKLSKTSLPGGKGNQAAWLDGQGAQLRVDNAEMPTPGPDEVVVKNGAVAVNLVDWKIQTSGGAFLKVWPIVLGADIAGELYKEGSNVTKFKKGGHVLAYTISLLPKKPHNGGFQLYTVAPAVSTAIIPSNISYMEPTVLQLAINTAAVRMYDLRYGDFSSVAKVVAVASSHNYKLVKGLGASEAINYNKSSVVEDVNLYKYVLPIARKLGGANIVTTLPRPEIVLAGVKFRNIMSPINPAVSGPLWEHYITPALEQGKLKCLSEPLRVGKGLRSIQKGLDTSKAGVSAKVAIEL